MSSFYSQKSTEISQCPICLSILNISNIYAISKCGHTFHQKCINQWISNAKNCPSCRTNAIKSDIIKLFIQENTEVVIPKREEILPYTETKHYNYCRRIMKECQCEIFRYKIGYLQYRCLKDFNIQIYSWDRTVKIQITLTDEIMITTYPSTQLEVLRQKTEEISTVTPNGKRLESFYQGIENGQKAFVVKTSWTSFDRSDKDYVRQGANSIQFCFPKFTVRRSLKKGENGKTTIRVYANDPNKSLRIRICPEHQSFSVEHLFGAKIIQCAKFERLCEHFTRID
uniref:RING-type domain-containing protein n=1 Tax=Panagrolaimus davidi TaxID=227884 RepID=A0A914QL69_9BILA